VNAAPAADRALRPRLIAAYAAIYLLWGSTFLVTRLGVGRLPPLLFAGSRFLLAGALLGAAALLRRERFPRGWREWSYVIVLSLLMISLSNGMSTVALQYIPSNEGALLAAGSALWIAWLGTFGPQGQPLPPRRLLGLLLGLAGVALLVWPRDATPSGHLAWQSLVLLSSFSWAVGTTLLRNSRLDLQPVAFNSATMTAGGAFLLAAGLASGELPRWEPDPLGLAALVYLAVLGSAVAYTAYIWLLRHSSAVSVGTFAYVNPAIATLLGWAVLGEALTQAQVAGMLVVLAAVALVTLPSRIA
jgi:drug/metabolite transporter (DMT)-like permease